MRTSGTSSISRTTWSPARVPHGEQPDALRLCIFDLRRGLMVLDVPAATDKTVFFGSAIDRRHGANDNQRHDERFQHDHPSLSGTRQSDRTACDILQPAFVSLPPPCAEFGQAQTHRGPQGLELILAETCEVGSSDAGRCPSEEQAARVPSPRGLRTPAPAPENGSHQAQTGPPSAQRTGPARCTSSTAASRR